jgi:DNA helicase II / ATP-dependent DNA helicase PcrA
MPDRYLFDNLLGEMRENPQQIEAVYEKGHCIVMAGPGSGKTRTLTAAIARTLLEDVVEPRGVACITYNNECAIELETKLSRLGVETNQQVYIGTVHSFSLTQILIPYSRCVLPELPYPFRIATKQERDAAVATAYSHVVGDANNPYYLWMLADKKRKRDVDRSLDTWKNQDTELTKLIEEYESELHKKGLIDFDDMPLIAFKIVKENQWVREALKAKFPVIFVDEYQDLGTALHELILLLCFSAGIRLFAVGDPDQSIYGFTGANPNLLSDLCQNPGIKLISLPFNYRCGTEIIEVSNAALGEERSYKAPEGTAKGTISFDPVDGDISDQAKYVMKDLIPKICANGVKIEQIAVLYRNYNEGNILANAANTEGVAFVRADSKALIPRNNRLSRLIEASTLWITGGWKISDPSFNRISSDAANLVLGNGATSDERYEIKSSLMLFLHKSIGTSESIHQWLEKFKATLIVPWRKKSRTITDDWDVIDRMIDQTDSKKGEKDMSLQNFCGRTEERGRLNLSTLHSAKGREFEVVIIFGMNEGSMPNDMDNKKPENIRELRRLFYVGVTRAKKDLHLVFRLKRYSPWVLELYRRLQQKKP